MFLFLLKDLMLYHDFNQTFWRKVDEYGRERMSRDELKLRQMREEGLKGNIRRKKRELRKFGIAKRVSSSPVSNYKASQDSF